MIEKGASNWNWGLRSACKGRNKEIVDLWKYSKIKILNN